MYRLGGRSKRGGQGVLKGGVRSYTLTAPVVAGVYYNTAGIRSCVISRGGEEMKYKYLQFLSRFFRNVYLSISFSEDF